MQFVGVVDPLGPTITCSEAQSRTVAHIWANGVNLPSEEEMQVEITGLSLGKDYFLIVFFKMLINVVSLHKKTVGLP